MSTFQYSTYNGVLLQQQFNGNWVGDIPNCLLYLTLFTKCTVHVHAGDSQFLFLAPGFIVHNEAWDCSEIKTDHPWQKPCFLRPWHCTEIWMCMFPFHCGEGVRLGFGWECSSPGQLRRGHQAESQTQQAWPPTVCTDVRATLVLSAVLQWEF